MDLKNLTEHYRVTYDNNDQMFILNKEGAGLLNMELLINYSGLYYYKHSKKDLVFLNTFSKNKESFNKR